MRQGATQGFGHRPRLLDEAGLGSASMSDFVRGGLEATLWRGNHEYGVASTSMVEWCRRRCRWEKENQESD